ncbi:uncharacterized protein LOC134231693 isoform X1 [Saccostrea cucullata]|uniref:uncharacterized protein LOC134231693 isoform X1 n=1 Tax=Saccostrea cuccullata TaxID=36930 RepID=UPI002ED22F42
MARPIEDPDGFTKNYCTVFKALHLVVAPEVRREIFLHINPLRLCEMLLIKESLSWIPLSTKQKELLKNGNTEVLNLAQLCQIHQYLMNSIRHVHTHIVFIEDIIEIQCILKELYIFQDVKAISEKSFLNLWKRLKCICMKLDGRFARKLIPSYRQIKAIRFDYHYGEEEEIFRMINENWDCEPQSLRLEVQFLRKIVREDTKKRKWHLPGIFAGFRKRLQRRVISRTRDDQDTFWSLNEGSVPKFSEFKDNAKSNVCSRDVESLDLDIDDLFSLKIAPSLSITSLASLENFVESAFENVDTDSLHNHLECEISESFCKHNGGYVHARNINDNTVEDKILLKSEKSQKTMEKRTQTEEWKPIQKMTSSGEKDEEDVTFAKETQLISRKLKQMSNFQSVESKIESHWPGPPEKDLAEPNKEERREFFMSQNLSSLEISQQFISNFVSRFTPDSQLSDIHLESGNTYVSNLISRNVCADHFYDVQLKTDQAYVQKVHNECVSAKSHAEDMNLLRNLQKTSNSALKMTKPLHSECAVNDATFEVCRQWNICIYLVSAIQQCTLCCFMLLSIQYVIRFTCFIKFASNCQNAKISGVEVTTTSCLKQNATDQKSEMCSNQEEIERKPISSNDIVQQQMQKQQLRKKIGKCLYSLQCTREETSKRKFQIVIRRASLQSLMDKFFNNFNEIAKKESKEVSQIINHYFNLLSYDRPGSATQLPVGSTPPRLERFFQEILENEAATAADTMHVEWMRLRTFSSYPSNTGVSTLQLARDGFYYTGHTTETRCFCCRNVYREWDETSNINEIHRRISPNCDIAFGRPTRNITIHDNQGGINLASSNEDSLAREQYQTRRQDVASERNTEQTSNSETEQAEAAQISKGDEQQSAQSPKLSKSKIKRDKRKKKKELASSSQSPPAGLAVSEVPQTTQATASISATGSQATDTEVASNATTNATGGASAAARSIPETTKEPLAVGGFQIEDVQHHSASIPSEISQQELNTFPISANVPPSLSQSQTSGLSQSQTSTQPQRGAGANPPGPPHGGANPPGPPQSGANPPAPTSAERLAQLDPLGINFDKPKYPAYAVYSTRLSSFDGWPSHMAQTPREMARAGYFYAGYGDYARCFFCGGGLRNWDRTDEPWMEHARWFPRCAFLRNNKGDKYVARVQRRHQEQEAGLEPSSQLPPPIERDMETAIAQALREMGFTNQIIQRAMNKWRLNLKPGRRHPPPMTAAGILDIIEEIQREEEDQAHTQPVTQERPLTIPGIQDLQIADGSSQASVQNISDGASALEENRTDFDPGDGQPREYGYDQREKQEKQVLQEDFLGLTETIVCKVCCDKDVAAAFLPCGHLVCCLDCAPAMRRCPLCAELIKGTVKTYFA